MEATGIVIKSQTSFDETVHPSINEAATELRAAKLDQKATQVRTARAEARLVELLQKAGATTASASDIQFTIEPQKPTIKSRKVKP